MDDAWVGDGTARRCGSAKQCRTNFADCSITVFSFVNGVLQIEINVLDDGTTEYADARVL